jgi:hypothetical protein
MIRAATGKAFLAIFLLGLSACGKSPTESSNSVPSAVSVVIADGVEVRLNAYVWRNFMPGGDPSLRVISKLQVAGSSSTGIYFSTFAWVSQDGAVWSTPMTAQPDVENSIGSGGPAWLAQSLVDVVVRFTDRHGRVHYLQQTGLSIDNPS